MTFDRGEIAWLLAPVFIYFATPQHPAVRIKLTITPRQGDEVVFDFVGRPKPDEDDVLMSARLVRGAMAEASEAMLPGEDVRQIDLLVWYGGHAEPHRITSTYEHRDDGTCTVAHSGMDG